MTAVALPSTVARASPRSARRARPSVNFLGDPEIRILAIASLGLYLTVAVWLKDSLHYNIGDSVARSADAVYVALSRDPHLAAIGFYWPPAFSFLQIPLVIMLKPFGRMDLAGPIVSALCMAGTIIVLGRFGRYLGVGRMATTAIVACFALNPLMVFYAANGMSESCSYLFLALATFAFIKYCRSRKSMDLALMATALAVVPMIRIEATAFAATIAVIAGYQHRQLKQSAIRAALVVLPATYVFSLWMGVQWVLLKDPLWFLHNTGQGSKGAPRTGKVLAAYDLPSATDKVAVAHWVVGYFWFFGPALILVVVACVAVRKWDTLREALGIIAVGAVFAGVQMELRLKGQGFNDPRYFTTIAVAAALGAIWAVAQLTSSHGAQGRNLLYLGTVIAAIGLLLFGDLNATVAEDSPARARVVGENVFFSRVLGSPHVNSSAAEWTAWHRLDDRLDPLLTGDHKVICDAGYAFAAVLYSAHPNHFIIINDRDFQKIYADPVGEFDYVISAAPQGTTSDTIAALLTPPNDWKLIGDFSTSVPGSGVAPIYLYGHVGSFSPAGQSPAGSAG